MSGFCSLESLWGLESGVTPESEVRRLESRRGLESGVWSLESAVTLGVWSLESLRSLKSGVWSHSGGWSLVS